MFRTFSILSSIGKNAVISSLPRQRHFPLLLNIQHQSSAGCLVKYCSTNSVPAPVDQPAASKNDDNSITNWNTIYHFPSIMITASVKRLKFYPMILTAVTVPFSLGMAYTNIWSMTTAEIVGAVGLTTTVTLSLFSLLTNNLVGFVYCNDQLTQVKISFLDPKGKRQNRIYSVDDLVARSELPRSFLKLYFPVKNHENNDVYKLVHRYGEIYDVQTFNKVFGHEVLPK
ncbi:transmembrane protein 186 [Anopheles bellator]|uniref:transmembrane protein 186 n=1 Tax=Anopheles bellator TaxID=139047 RepID=UPI0026496027|nr:transmembrane protein 186 [Anopheles bellator]